MKIDVNWLGKDFHFEAENETNGKIRIDGNNEIGGLEGGLAPMQLLLAGVGGCSAIDVLHILEKQQQKVASLKVEVDGDRQKVEGASHTEYRSIHLHFILSGDLDPKKWNAHSNYPSQNIAQLQKLWKRALRSLTTMLLSSLKSPLNCL